MSSFSTLSNKYNDTDSFLEGGILDQLIKFPVFYGFIKFKDLFRKKNPLTGQIPSPDTFMTRLNQIHAPYLISVRQILIQGVS